MTAEKKIQLLEMIEKDPTLTCDEIAVMLDLKENDVSSLIEEMKEEHIICGSRTVINWDNIKDDDITALIELRVIPQSGDGYQKIAELLCSYPQVENLYLMSGAYDFLVTVRGKNLKEVSLFVNEKLAGIHEVQSTSTHFILTKYKQMGVRLAAPKKDNRMLVTP